MDQILVSEVSSSIKKLATSLFCSVVARCSVLLIDTTLYQASWSVNQVQPAMLRISVIFTLAATCSCVFVHYSSKYREAAEPFLEASVQVSLHACERRCATMKVCRYGTFFSDSKACVLSAKRGKLAACSFCYSFARIISKYGKYENDGRVPRDSTPAPTQWPLLMKLDGTLVLLIDTLVPPCIKHLSR